MNLLSKLKLTRPKLEMYGAIICALGAAAGLFWWMIQFAGNRELIKVAAASGNLSAPRLLTADDLKTIFVPREALPDTGVTNREAVAGHLLTRSLVKNQILTMGDLTQDRDPASESTLVPAGKVGFILPGSWLASAYPKVRKNDLLTVYVAFPPNKQFPSGSGIVLDAVEVLSVNADKNGAPSQALLALGEAEVGRILQSYASGYKLAAVVESAGARPPITLSVPSSTQR